MRTVRFDDDPNEFIVSTRRKSFHLYRYKIFTMYSRLNYIQYIYISHTVYFFFVCNAIVFDEYVFFRW